MSNTRILAWSESQEAIGYEAKCLERDGYTVTVQTERGSCETDHRLDHVFTVRGCKKNENER